MMPYVYRSVLSTIKVNRYNLRRTYSRVNFHREIVVDVCKPYSESVQLDFTNMSKEQER